MIQHQKMKLPSHEVLSRLARDDPPAFEALRRQLIEDSISRAPDRNQARLRGIQFQVDGIRRLSHSPLGASVKIHDLMWDSFLLLNEKLQALVRLGRGRPQLCEVNRKMECHPERSGRIIAFQPRSPVVGGTCTAKPLPASPVQTSAWRTPP